MHNVSNNKRDGYNQIKIDLIISLTYLVCVCILIPIVYCGLFRNINDTDT